MNVLGDIKHEIGITDDRNFTRAVAAVAAVHRLLLASMVASLAPAAPLSSLFSALFLLYKQQSYTIFTLINRKSAFLFIFV